MPEERPQGDRAGGVHVFRGSDLRIRDFTFSLDASTGELADSSMVTEVRTDIFGQWLLIAENASDESEAARKVALEAVAEDAEMFSDAVEREFRAAMVAVAASAFAIDSFYASVVEHAPETKVKASGRDADIFETLKRAFSLSRARRAPYGFLFEHSFGSETKPSTLGRRGSSRCFTPSTTWGWTHAF